MHGRKIVTRIRECQKDDLELLLIVEHIGDMLDVRLIDRASVLQGSLCVLEVHGMLEVQDVKTELMTDVSAYKKFIHQRIIIS